MQSNGGSIAAATARAAAVRTILSGPAAGVVGARAVAERAGYERIITFDMGGTSTDVSLVDGEIGMTTESFVGGYPVRLPIIDIHTVGAGGGSIAYVDSGGALRVGPRSAGADPGPVCYGRGTEPTVSDANLLLGRLEASYFLGGRMKLDVERARIAVRELASQLGMEEMALAEGIIRVANSNMERAIRVVSVQRGFDPREFALLAFGGAGGMHACEIAATLEIAHRDRAAIRRCVVGARDAAGGRHQGLFRDGPLPRRPGDTRESRRSVRAAAPQSGVGSVGGRIRCGRDAAGSCRRCSLRRPVVRDYRSILATLS